MNNIRSWIIGLILMLMLGGTSGCSGGIQSLFQKTKSTEPPLIRVQIQFTDQKQTICYLKSLGLEKDAQVYTGGPSANNMYDQDGNIVGSFNYQHVLYITVLPEEVSSD
ncbi:MAG: hypothetical protein VB084_08590 [Syntrophomonadaceae bacterium]|nr:hypothetical protein [Syntrophomonadaceae bacterium]